MNTVEKAKAEILWVEDDFEFRNALAKIAILIGTPFVTCHKTSDRELSATVSVNSMPRTIGPGCITSASGLPEP